MKATYSEKSRWFDSGVKRGFSFLIIVEDMVDFTQYPVFADEDNFEQRFNASNGVNMQKIVGIINLDKDKESQIRQEKPWEYPAA